MRGTAQPVPASFFGRPATEVAPDLLGKVVRNGGRHGRIVEVEAYGGSDDPASHGHRRRTERNSVMFGPAGHLYVYFTYGMHWCANLVTGLDGEASAVLVRAAEPLAGVDQMYVDRGPAARRDRDLMSGPAKFCQAMGIDGSDNGQALSGGPVRVLDDGTVVDQPETSGRIGVSAGAELPHRWFDPTSIHVSR